MDKDLNVFDTFSEFYTSGPSYIGLESHILNEQRDELYIFMRYRYDWMPPVQANLGIITLNLDGSYIHTVLDTVYSQTTLPTYGSSLLYNNFKYFGTYNHTLGTINCELPTSDSPNYLNIYSLDSLLNIRWKLTLGGTYTHILKQVIATPDSGVLLLVNRYAATNLVNQMDAYYLKLDKYGNPQPGYLDTYTSIDATPAMPLAQLRYDITTQALYLPPHLTGGSYRLYHSNGSLVESFRATGYRIGLDKWPPGLYLYDYTAPDGHRYRGKLVK